MIIPLLYTNSLLAQEEEKPRENKKKGFFQNLDSIRAARLRFGKSIFTPFIAPSYSPELEFLVSAGGLLTWKSEKENPILERSSLPFSIGYSSNGSLQISAKLTFYGKKDMNRGSGEFWLKSMPDNYWGVGYDNGLNTLKSDSTTAYHRTWFKIYYKLVHRIGKNTFVGGAMDVNKTTATEMNPVMKVDPNVMKHDSTIRNSGFGLTFQYDSRDLIVNAYSGIFFDVSFILYSQFRKDRIKYQALEIDYRQYKQLGDKRRVLAWQIKSRNTFGDTPWPEMSQLGTPFDLRGYTWGRFRDRSMVFGLLEYRHMFERKRPNKKGSFHSKAGFVGWIGTGALANDEFNYSNFLPNYGIGFRLETQPRMNIRLDYGIGKDSNAFYVTFNEAF